MTMVTSELGVDTLERGVPLSLRLLDTAGRGKKNPCQPPVILVFLAPGK